MRGLPYEAVYELVKRFHFHLALKLFIDDKEGFEELKSAYGGKDEAGRRAHIHVTELLLSQMDNIVGFNSVSEGETDEVDCDEPPNCPIKDSSITYALVKGNA